jgi:hypothetical protein
MSTNSLPSDEECFDFVLVNLCDIDESKVTEIKKKCTCLIDLLQNINVANFFNNVQLSKEEKTKIIQFGNMVRRAEIDTEEYKQIHGLNEVDYLDVFNYAQENLKKEFDSKRKELFDREKEKLKKLYEYVNKKHKSSMVPAAFQISTSSIVLMLKQIIPFVEKVPFFKEGIARGLLSSADEIVSFCKGFDIIKGNIMSGLLIFGCLSAWTLGKNIYRYYKKEIKFKDLLIFSGFDMAIHGTSCLSITACGIAGSLIGSVIPVCGTLIGGIVGSLIGAFGSKKLIEPLINKFRQELMVKTIDDTEIDLNLYEESLRKFSIEKDTSVKSIKEIRRAYLLAYHPDKNISNETLLDEKTKRYIELETHFRIIEAFRKANGTWE